MHGDLFSSSSEPFSLELELVLSGFRAIAGVDEVGRGALAGPVVAAAVILGPNGKTLAGRCRDSKKLTPGEREALVPEIELLAVAIGIGVVGPDEIDRINILRASLQAMKLAVDQLRPAADICLIDGNQKAPITVPQKVIVKGDDRVLSIAAASVVAKVARDRMMRELSKEYPVYGFEIHKGYGTENHRQALVNHGPSPVHRRSFQLRAV